MKRGQRVLCMLLAVVLCLSLLPVGAMAEESAVTEEGEPELETTSAVGTLLENTLAKEERLAAGYCSVTDVHLEDMTANVTLQTDRAAHAVAAVYTEDGLTMLGMGSVLVEAGAEEAVVELSVEEMPEYFVIAAYLLDGESYEPLCERYISRYYTSGFQELLASTAEDYDPERVLLLEEGVTETNFLVFGEDTLHSSEGDEVNRIIDNGDGTYTIENADEDFCALQPGDSFAHTYEDGFMLIVVAATVSVDGTTVTVVKDADAELSDVFDYVKVEADSEGADVQVDTSSLDEGLTFLGITSGQSRTRAVDANVSRSHEVELGVGWEDDGLEVKGTVKYGVKVSLQAYISPLWQYVRLEKEYLTSVALEIEATHEQLIEIEICPLYIPLVPGIGVGINPTVICEVETTIALACEVKGAFVLEYDSRDGYREYNRNPVPDGILDGTVRVFVGVRAKVSLCVLSEDFFSMGIYGEAGVEMEAKEQKDEITETDKIHTCTICFDGEAYFKVKLGVEAKILGFISPELTLVELRAKLADFYVSLLNGGFGWGKCPNYTYRVELTLKTPDGAPATNITVQGLPLDSAPVTDGYGKAVFYLPNGEYAASVVYKDIITLVGIQVQSGAVSVEETVQVPGPIAWGEYGPNVTWELFDDGELVFTGTGIMGDGWEDSNSNPGYMQYRDSITSVVIGEGITCVARGAFSFYENIKKVSLPSTLKEIGKYAFGGCVSLEEIEIPYGVTTIGEFAFQRCGKLKSIEIPHTVTRMDPYAFYYCEGLLSVIVPGSLTTLSDNMFAGCTNLLGVHVASGVTSIEYCAFMGCERLLYINIPASVTNIGNWASSSCLSLNKIYYEGTQEQWNEINFNEGNTEILNAEIIYSYGVSSVGETLTAVPPETEAPGETEMSAETETPVETEVPEETEMPAETETPEEVELPLPVEPVKEGDTSGDEGETEPEIRLLAAFGGETVFGDGCTTVTFGELEPDGRYVLLVMRDGEAENLLSSDNVLYVAQGTAGTAGNLSFLYALAEDVEAGAVRVYGPARDIAAAQVTVRESENGEVTVLVIYGERILREGLDYELETVRDSFGRVRYTVIGLGGYGGILSGEICMVSYDVNGDETEDARDVVALMKCALGVKIEAGADVNGDETVNLQDVIRLLRYLASCSVNTG